MVQFTKMCVAVAVLLALASSTQDSDSWSESNDGVLGFVDTGADKGFDGRSYADVVKGIKHSLKPPASAPLRPTQLRGPKPVNAPKALHWGPDSRTGVEVVKGIKATPATLPATPALQVGPMPVNAPKALHWGPDSRSGVQVVRDGVSGRPGKNIPTPAKMSYSRMAMRGIGGQNAAERQAAANHLYGKSQKLLEEMEEDEDEDGDENEDEDEDDGEDEDEDGDE